MLDNIENLARNYIKFVDPEYHFSDIENYENGLLGNPFYSIGFDWEFSFGLIDGGHYNFLAHLHRKRLDEMIRNRITTFGNPCPPNVKLYKFMLTLHDRSHYHNLITIILEEMNSRNVDEIIYEKIKYVIYLNMMLAYAAQ